MLRDSKRDGHLYTLVLAYAIADAFGHANCDAVAVAHRVLDELGERCGNRVGARVGVGARDALAVGVAVGLCVRVRVGVSGVNSVALGVAVIVARDVGLFKREHLAEQREQRKPLCAAERLSE